MTKKLRRIAERHSLPLGEGGSADCAETDEVFTGIGNDIIHRWGGPYNIRQDEVDHKGKARVSPSIWFGISLYAVDLQLFYFFKNPTYLEIR